MALEQRLLGLDLLRGLAALTVAVSHFMIDRSLVPSQAETVSILAVEIFFVLSGFVLAPQIAKCATHADFETIRVFLFRRWMRTVPPYLLALLCMTMVTPQARLDDAARYALYIQNLFFQANVSDYFAVAWSLAVEEWFYVVFPPCIVLASRLMGGYRLTVLVATVLVFIVAITLVRLNFADNAQWGYNVRRVVVFRIDSIAYGVLLWALVQSHIPTARDVVLAITALVAAVAACALISAAIASGRPMGNTFFPFAAALLGSSAVLSFRFAERALPSWSAGPCLFVGRVSYSVYLFHLLVLVQVSRLGLSPLMDFAAFLAVLVGLAWAIYRYFERPFLDARPRYRDEAATDVGLAFGEPGDHAEGRAK